MHSGILVLSGPSGAGKSTIINAAADAIGEFYFSVSTTTREPREGEVNGVDYYFVTKEEFEEGIARGDFLEYATVHGNYYGTSLLPVKKALSEGKLVIFDIDVQGHKLVREAMGDIVVSAFITPPSLKVLKERLTSRGSDRMDIIQKRLENAKEEIKEISSYDFVIINDNLKEAKEAFIAIANASRYKMEKAESQKFIKEWLES